MDRLSFLPSELLNIIITILEVRDVVRLSQTSKRFELQIDTWDPEYFDKNSCTYPSRVPIRDNRVLTKTYLRRFGVDFIRNIVSLAPPNMSNQASDLVDDVEVMLKTCETSYELHFQYEKALRRAEKLILYDIADSMSNVAIYRFVRKRRNQWIDEPLWQYFLQVRLDKLWEACYPSEFMEWSYERKASARVRILSEFLAHEQRSTYEVVPRDLTGRAFFLHKTRQHCVRCASRTSVRGYFHYRYCHSCVKHLTDVQESEVKLNMVGIWHCFGDSAEPQVVAEVDTEGNCLYSLQAYEAAFDKKYRCDTTGGDAENKAALGKLKDIFDGCYVNEDRPRGLFELLCSHYKCRTILQQTEASAAFSQLDIVTDYVLSACTRLSSVVDRYRVNHDRPDADVLACQAVALYVKYGALTMPDTRRNHNIAKRAKHDAYRLSYCFAWDCLVTQKRLTDDAELDHISKQFRVSNARGDVIEHRRGEHHAEHEQVT